MTTAERIGRGIGAAIGTCINHRNPKVRWTKRIVFFGALAIGVYCFGAIVLQTLVVLGFLAAMGRLIGGENGGPELLAKMASPSEYKSAFGPDRNGLYFGERGYCDDDSVL